MYVYVWLWFSFNKIIPLIRINNGSLIKLYVQPQNKTNDVNYKKRVA